MSGGKASTPKVIELLKSMVDKPPIRAVLKKFSGMCEKDGKNRLEVALELYTGVRESACWTCSHIVYPAVKRVIDSGASSFGLTPDEVKEKFKDPYWRRRRSL